MAVGQKARDARTWRERQFAEEYFVVRCIKVHANITEAIGKQRGDPHNLIPVGQRRGRDRAARVFAQDDIQPVPLGVVEIVSWAAEPVGHHARIDDRVAIFAPEDIHLEVSRHCAAAVEQQLLEVDARFYRPIMPFT